MCVKAIHSHVIFLGPQMNESTKMEMVKFIEDTLEKKKVLMFSTGSDRHIVSAFMCVCI